MTKKLTYCSSGFKVRTVLVSHNCISCISFFFAWIISNVKLFTVEKNFSCLYKGILRQVFL